jgi:polysaccharide biosynthesis/export protein
MAYRLHPANKMNLKFLYIGIFTLFMFSCVPQRKVIYLQGTSEDLIAYKKIQYTIHAHDVLLITISSLNPQVSEFFNLKQDKDKGADGYMVNDLGYIYLPVLDSLFVKGQTTAQIQSNLQRAIREHVTDATVVVKMANFNVTVLGEVGNPGHLSFQGEEINILQAIGMAGDISDFGNKKKVRLIRKEGEGNKFINLDLTDRAIMNSPYFYLQPNDVIYVEPLKAKNFKLNISQLSLVVGLASLFFLVLNVVKN